MISTNTQKHFRWAVESGTALVVLGVGLTFLVMHTLGSFDAATVILALFVGFWAFVLGNTVLFSSSIWLFMRRRDFATAPAVEQPAVHERAPIRLPRLCHH